MKFKSDSQRRAVMSKFSNRFSRHDYDTVHLYHGTTDKLLKDKMGHESFGSKKGLIYMTTNPAVACVYAEEAAKTGTGWEDSSGISNVDKNKTYDVVGGVPVIVEVEIPKDKLSGWNKLTVDYSLDERRTNSGVQGKEISPFSSIIYDELPFESIPIEYIKDIHYLGKNHTAFSGNSEVVDDDIAKLDAEFKFIDASGVHGSDYKGMKNLFELLKAGKI